MARNLTRLAPGGGAADQHAPGATRTAATAAATPPAVVAVVAHTTRHGMAARLAHQVAADYLTVDDGHLGGTGNHIAAWAWCLGAARRGGWAVVLEDDAQPVDGFRDQLHQALAVAPAPIVSLYLGTGHPGYVQPRVAEAVVRAGDTAAWIVGTRLHHAVGVAIRADLIADMLATINPRKPIDEAISAWAARRGHRVACSWPSLVGHADLAPTYRRGRVTRQRRAWKVGTRKAWNGIEVDL